MTDHLERAKKIAAKLGYKVPQPKGATAKEFMKRLKETKKGA